MRAEFELPNGKALARQTQLAAAAEGAGTESLPAVDRITLAMGSLQSEQQRLLAYVREWCAHGASSPTPPTHTLTHTHTSTRPTVGATSA